MATSTDVRKSDQDVSKSSGNEQSGKESIRYSATELLHTLYQAGFNIRHNELLLTPEVTATSDKARRKLLGRKGVHSSNPIKDEPVIDRFDSVMQEELAQIKGGKGGSADSKRYHRALDHAPVYHPFDDYFAKLENANVENERTAFVMKDLLDRITFSSDADKLFFGKALKLWGINHVSRVKRRHENSKLQNPVLVFQGLEQGTGKSALVFALCPPSLKKYYREYESFNPENKDHKRSVSESWIMEIPEVGGTISKTDFNRLKSYLTLDEDTYRSVYDRRTTTRKRLCSFIATSNDSLFLNDPTGNRRWWVCRVLRIDREWVLGSFDCDQFWAYIYAEAKKVNFTPVWPEDFVLEAFNRAAESTIEEPIDDLVSMFEYAPGKTLTNLELRVILGNANYLDSKQKTALGKLIAAIIKVFPEVEYKKANKTKFLKNVALRDGKESCVKVEDVVEYHTLRAVEG